jgi:hypothetical protein
MHHRLIRLAIAILCCCHAALAGAAETFDGLTGVLEGQARWSVQGLTDQSLPLFAIVAFDQGQWGFKDTTGSAASGSYQMVADAPPSASLLFDPDRQAQLEAVLASGVAAMISAQLGVSVPIQATISDIQVLARTDSDFSRMELEVTVGFLATAPSSGMSATGTLSVELGGTTVGGPAAGGRVVVNGIALPPARLERLENRHGIVVAPGTYWYDRRSGLWGLAGGPSLGQIPPRLRLGGKLQTDASGGRTAVRVNGRSLHPVELAFLESRLGAIPAGRYAVNPNGRGRNLATGRRFDLGTSAGGHRSILGHSLTGSVIGDDSTVGFIDGATGVTCGPDGGCF